MKYRVKNNTRFSTRQIVWTLNLIMGYFFVGFVFKSTPDTRAVQPECDKAKSHLFKAAIEIQRITD